MVASLHNAVTDFLCYSLPLSGVIANTQSSCTVLPRVFV